jgi:hypothetical protein
MVCPKFASVIPTGSDFGIRSLHCHSALRRSILVSSTTSSCQVTEDRVLLITIYYFLNPLITFRKTFELCSAVR